MINDPDKRQTQLPKISKTQADRPHTYRSHSLKSRQLSVEAETSRHLQHKLPIKSPTRNSLEWDLLYLDTERETRILMTVNKAQKLDRYTAKTAREERKDKENEENIFIPRDKFTAAKKSLHQRRYDYVGERVLVSGLKPVKPLRLERIRQQVREELSGWNNGEECRVCDLFS